MAQMTPARGRRRAVALALALLPAAAPAQQAPELLQQAREAAWAGRTGEALQRIERHLATHPDDRAARLDRVRWLAWRGDYAAALEALDALGADDAEARALRARVLAWAGQRRAALALNMPLYAAAPADYDIAWTQALAARLGERPHEALEPLARVRALQPDSRDTRLLAAAVWLPLASNMALPLSRYSDSDDIEVRSAGLEADLRFGSDLRLLGTFMRRTHAAPSDGPFAPVGGGDEVEERRVLVGLRQAFSPYAALQVQLGRSRLDAAAADEDEDTTVGRVAFSHRPRDAFGYALAVERERVAYSPRALSLGLVREGVRAELHAQPTLRGSLDLGLAWDDFDDGNRRHALNLDYRRAIRRSERAMLDLGAQGEWQDFARDPGNGYYSPRRYVRLAPTLGAYLRLGEESGLSLTAALGAQRDASFDRWRRASDVSAALTLGLFTPWQVVASAAYSERLNMFGRYEGVSAGLTVRYRFGAER